MVQEFYANNATTTLNNSGTLTSGATSCVVTDGSVFPATGNFRIIIDSEIIIVGARSSNTLSSMTRGAEGTAAASHADGSDVTNVLTAGSMAALVTGGGYSASFNDLTVAGNNTPGLGNWKVGHTNGSGVLTAVALGAAGTFLQSNGASAAPTFVVPALTSTSAPLTTDQTLSSADTLTDLVGCSLSLAAGTWMVWGIAAFALSGTSTYFLLSIADGSNTDYQWARGAIVTGGAQTLSLFAQTIVTPGSTTTYKLRGQNGRTDTVVKQNGGSAGQVETAIFAVRIA